MAHSAHEATRRSLRRALIGGAALAGLLMFGIGGWAVTTELSGAVIASGSLVVESSVKTVQHPTGGVIAELRVREGDEVQEGDVLVRLDNTVTQANLAVVTKGMDELAARQARLKAEQDGSTSIIFPEELVLRKTEPAVANLMAEEVHLFDLRRAAREGTKAQLDERLAQLRQKIQGMSDQIVAKEEEIDLILRELTGLRELWEKRLVPLARLTALERDAARLGGERGALLSSIAETRDRITETELQVLQVDQDLRAEVGRELAEIRGKLAELIERRVAAEDQLGRTEIRAPQEGVVHQLAVHTVGGVINPGEPIMLIVPKADSLTVEARIAPQDIDQLRIGQPAVLRFSAFDQHTTPELAGVVSLISANTTEDDETGKSFYTVHVTPIGSEIQRLGDIRLVPGMPVETFIQTDSRTVISYLTKPLYDQMARAWREN